MGFMSCPFRSTVLQCGARLQIHNLNYWTVQAVSGARFLTGVCLSVTLLIVDLWQYFVCCIRSGATRCTLLMVLYLDRMWQCGLHAVNWSHIGILIRRFAAEPRSTSGLIPLSVSLWNDLPDSVFDGVGLVGFKIRANALLLA